MRRRSPADPSALGYCVSRGPGPGADRLGMFAVDGGARVGRVWKRCMEGVIVRLPTAQTHSLTSAELPTCRHQRRSRPGVSPDVPIAPQPPENVPVVAPASEAHTATVAAIATSAATSTRDSASTTGGTDAATKGFASRVAVKVRALSGIGTEGSAPADRHKWSRPYRPQTNRKDERAPHRTPRLRGTFSSSPQIGLRGRLFLRCACRYQIVDAAPLGRRRDHWGRDESMEFASVCS